MGRVPWLKRHFIAYSVESLSVNVFRDEEPEGFVMNPKLMDDELAMSTLLPMGWVSPYIFTITNWPSCIFWWLEHHFVDMGMEITMLKLIFLYHITPHVESGTSI